MSLDEKLIARNIKGIRKQQNMTLQKLADLTGLTKGYLSRIERSEKAPPYSTLYRIAMAFRVEAADLLGENLQDIRDIRMCFTKRNERKLVERVRSLSKGSLYGYEYAALASGKPGKNMEPYVIEPAFNEEAMFQHEGEEFLFVLEGKHEFVYDGKKYIMEEGDCVYFDAAVPHSGRSMGPQKAKLLAVMYNYRRL
jgi:transcriptional regulator with XRE-family HTH domain